MEGSVDAVAPAKELNAENECLKQNGASEEPVVSTNGTGGESNKEEEQVGTKRKSLEGAGDHVESKKLKPTHDEEEEETEEADEAKDAEKESAEETSEECEKVDKENVPEAEEKTTKSLDDPVAASGDVEPQEAAC